MGMRVRRTTVIGTVEQYPTRDLAEAAVNGLRMQVNEDRLRHPGAPHYCCGLDRSLRADGTLRTSWLAFSCDANCVPPIPDKVDTAALGESERVLCPKNSG